MKNIILILLLSSSLLNSAETSDIIGRWENTNTDTKEILTFKSDGTLLIALITKDGTFHPAEIYNIQNNSLHVGEGERKINWGTVSIKDNILKLSNNGKETTYVRVQPSNAK
jgi:hypothetical protein